MAKQRTLEERVAALEGTLDRATAERDAYEKAHKYMCGEVKKSDEAMEKGLARIRDLEAQLADARSEAVALRATEENLRAQLAARTDATPLGWVNVYEPMPWVSVLFKTKDEALKQWESGVKRIAVPVYEHPSRPVAPSVVTDEEIHTALDNAFLDSTTIDIRSAQVKHVRKMILDRAAVDAASVVQQMKAMVLHLYAKHYADNGVQVVPFEDAEGLLSQISNMVSGLTRAAAAPEYHLVGACVVREDGYKLAWTDDEGPQSECERRAFRFAKDSALQCTAHRLYRGEPITEATP